MGIQENQQCPHSDINHSLCEFIHLITTQYRLVAMLLAGLLPLTQAQPLIRPQEARPCQSNDSLAVAVITL